MPVLLLVLLSISLSIGMSIIVLVVRRSRRFGAGWAENAYPPFPVDRPWAFHRPGCWLAVKTRSLHAVQSALRLHNPKPCSWLRGLAGEEKLFIAPPVKGWILVMGSGLPDPSDDVDACYRFVLDISRKLGQVQLFSFNRVLHHHAWVKADTGKVLRAYAWAGKTVWQQGPRTQAENELELKCFDYTEGAERESFDQPDSLSTNTDKVPLLAARWSLDPARIDGRFLEAAAGIAGEPPRRY